MISYHCCCHPVVAIVVHLLILLPQTSNYAVNYRGHPFMESITENRKMFYTLTIPIVTLCAIVLGWFPEFTQWFQLIEFEGEYRINVVKVNRLSLYYAKNDNREFNNYDATGMYHFREFNFVLHFTDNLRGYFRGISR